MTDFFFFSFINVIKDIHQRDQRHWNQISSFPHLSSPSAEILLYFRSRDHFRLHIFKLFTDTDVFLDVHVEPITWHVEPITWPEDQTTIFGVGKVLLKRIQIGKDSKYFRLAVPPWHKLLVIILETFAMSVIIVYLVQLLDLSFKYFPPRLHILVFKFKRFTEQIYYSWHQLKLSGDHMFS